MRHGKKATKGKLELIGVSGTVKINSNTRTLNTFEQLGLQPGKAICYSGFRDGQYPGGEYPTYDQVKEDLLILQDEWKYLRLYDSSTHAHTVLEVIRKEQLDFKIMLGADIGAEVNNFNCPWGGGVYDEDELEANKEINRRKIDALIELGNTYEDIIFSLDR